MFCANPRPGRFFSTRCRKCNPCRRLRQEDWASRTVWEVLAADKAVFITLTFRRKPTDGYEVFQRYAKRVRSALARRVAKGAKLRFVCASEFGERTGRYHLHGILCIHGGNPPVRFLRDRWQGGFTHARAIEAGGRARVARYVSKYLAKDGRIHASNGFGTSSGTVERVNHHVRRNPTVEAVFAAFPGAQIVAVKEPDERKAQRAPYALRKHWQRTRNVGGYVERQRPVGGLRDLSSAAFDDVWGDFLPLNSVRAWLSQAEYELREAEHSEADEDAEYREAS